MEDLQALVNQLLDQERRLLAVLAAAEANSEKYGGAIERGLVELNRLENVLETLFGKQRSAGEN